MLWLYMLCIVCNYSGGSEAAHGKQKVSITWIVTELYVCSRTITELTMDAFMMGDQQVRQLLWYVMCLSAGNEDDYNNENKRVRL